MPRKDTMSALAVPATVPSVVTASVVSCTGGGAAGAGAAVGGSAMPPPSTVPSPPPQADSDSAASSARQWVCLFFMGAPLGVLAIGNMGSGRLGADGLD